jgi:hypothetical protein
MVWRWKMAMISMSRRKLSGSANLQAKVYTMMSVGLGFGDLWPSPNIGPVNSRIVELSTPT